MDFILEKERRTPLAAEADVAVVGGGVAGVAAALASARLGAKTVLIEKETAPGGLATLGNVIVYLPICDGAGRQVIGGIGEELLRLSVGDGFNGIPDCWKEGGDPDKRRWRRFRVDFNPASFMLAMEDLLLKAGVDICYDTRFCDATTENGKISALILENKSGRIALKCKTVVDCSGDADVCATAGEKTESLRTNVECGWFFHFEPEGDGGQDDADGNPGNEERPKSKDGRVFRLKVNSASKPFCEDPRKIPEGVKGYAGDDWRDVSAHIIATHRMIRERIKSLRERPDGPDVYPAIVPLIPSFRMTRRLVGEIEINYEDDHRYFEDAVGMTGDWRRNGPVYFIPFRALRGVRNSNLVTAGRCISSAGAAWDVTRVIPACALTGEAAGTAAAMAAAADGDMKALGIKSLQEQLIRQGAILDRPAKG